MYLFGKRIAIESRAILKYIHALEEPSLLLFEVTWWRCVFFLILRDRIANPAIYLQHKVHVYRDAEDVRRAKAKAGDIQNMVFFWDAENDRSILESDKTSTEQERRGSDDDEDDDVDPGS